jgi:hypothetical protein
MTRLAAPIVVLALLVMTVGCGQTATAQPLSAPSALAAPDFELSLAATDPEQVIPDAGPFKPEASATMNSCSRTDDGFWQLRYSGGEPYVRVGLLVGPEATTGRTSDDVSAEIVIGSPLTTLLNFDQPGYRSGDGPGRSTATVTTTSSADAITFEIAATTPRAKADFTDYPYTVDVDLTVSCPLGG